MRKSIAFVALVSLGLLPSIRAGEFPDSWTWDSKPEMRTAHAALEGRQAPKLTLEKWVGDTVAPADMKGKVVVVDFYATWCGPCMAAIPHNNELLSKYKSQGLVLFGVCTSSNGQEKMADTVKERGMEYPTAADPDLVNEKNWAVQYYPTYAVIDRNGVIRALGLQPQHVEEVVKKLLAEKGQAS